MCKSKYDNDDDDDDDDEDDDDDDDDDDDNNNNNNRGKIRQQTPVWSRTKIRRNKSWR